MKMYRPPEQWFGFLLALVLLSSLAPVATLAAQTPRADLNIAGPAQDEAGTDAADACANLRILAVNDTLEQNMLRSSTKAEWIKFTVQQDTRYRLEVKNAAGLQLRLHDRCDANAPAVEVQDGQLEFTATRHADYYLRIDLDLLPSVSTGSYEVTLTPAAPYSPTAIPLADVPADVLRRATEFLEGLRGSDLAPEWINARINPAARIFYRPDIQVAAYYEFTVEKPVGTAFEPAGFIELSTGEHDYMVTSWDASGASPTAELEEIAPLGVTLTKFYRLDMQNWAAEYTEPTAIGIDVAADDAISLGGLPTILEGQNALPHEAAPLVSETLTVDEEGNEKYEGPAEKPTPLEPEAWASWAALKDGYALAYENQLASLEESASAAWEQEKMLKENGEALIKGDVRTVHGLAGQTLSGINVTGAGADAKYLKQELLGDPGAPTGITLTVLDEPADKQTRLPFEVALQYVGGNSETVKFTIVNAATLYRRTYLPLVSRPTTVKAADTAAAQTTAAPSWGPWAYWWATGSTGEDAGSIRYDQIRAHTGVNTSNCWSGCGATAWAMVYAWVDRRAAFNQGGWWDHDGIYRVNGGYGADATAPLTQDAGVNNMTWEIRNRIGTFCSGSGGAAYYTRMIDASNYVRPRVSTAWGMTTRYDPTGLCWFGACNGARDLARYQIQTRRAPVILAVNDHYPMAYGYAEQSQRKCVWFVCWTEWNRWFYVNQGWGGAGNDWVNHDSVKFAGVYYDR